MGGNLSIFFSHIDVSLSKKCNETMSSGENLKKMMMNNFNGLISRLDMAEERISELEDVTVKNPKLKSKKKNIEKK